MGFRSGRTRSSPWTSPSRTRPGWMYRPAPFPLRTRRSTTVAVYGRIHRGSATSTSWHAPRCRGCPERDGHRPGARVLAGSDPTVELGRRPRRLLGQVVERGSPPAAPPSPGARRAPRRAQLTGPYAGGDVDREFSRASQHGRHAELPVLGRGRTPGRRPGRAASWVRRRSTLLSGTGWPSARRRRAPAPSMSAAWSRMSDSWWVNRSSSSSVSQAASRATWRRRRW